MKLIEAIAILENHNEWRRNNDVPNSMIMVSPKELGIAIDLVVSKFKESTTFFVVDKSEQLLCGNCGITPIYLKFRWCNDCLIEQDIILK